MTTPVRIIVEGKPLSVNAAYRVVRLGRRAGLAKSAEALTYQARVRLAARKAMRGRDMLDGDLVIELVAYWPRRNADSDAATKLTKDALQGVVYANDRIVVEDRSRKAHDPERPRVELLVYRDGYRGVWQGEWSTTTGQGPAPVRVRVDEMDDGT